MSSNYFGNPANHPTAIQIPSDGDGPIKAADVNAGFEGLKDYVEWLRVNPTLQNVIVNNSLTLANGATVTLGPGVTVAVEGTAAITVKSGATLDAQAGSLVNLNGTTHAAGLFIVDAGGNIRVDPGAFLSLIAGSTTQFDGDAKWTVGSTLKMKVGSAFSVESGATATAESGSTVKLLGRTVYRAPYRPADAALVVVDTTMGDVVMLPVPSVSGHAVQLRTSVNPPANGERIRLVMPPEAFDGKAWDVKREDGIVIAELHGYTVTESAVGKQGCTWLECQFEGGVWRGGTPSGYVVAGAGW